MSGDTKIILRALGLVVHVPGLMAIASLPVCWLFDEASAAPAFLWTGAASLGLGQLLYQSFRPNEEIQLHHCMLVAALAWVLVPFLGAIPYLTIPARLGSSAASASQFQEPWNALFEAFSGYTGTGLTVSLHPSQLPRTLQWWRSFTEWVGGVGVIVLMLSILKPTAGAHHLYFSEAREEKILPSVAATVRTIWWIYALITLISILLLRLAAMPWWEAVNHGMTGIATGGFTVTDHSLRDYSLPIKLLTVFIMLAGATSFAVHYQVLTKSRWPSLWHDSQHRSLWFLAGIGTIALLLENYWQAGSFLWTDSLFQWVSALATAGFQTVDIASWSPTSQLLLSFAMVVGGAAGSTCGGIKQVRFVYLLKGIVWRFRAASHRPHELVRYEVNGQALAEADANRSVETAAVLGTLWLLLLGIGILVLIHVTPARFTLSEVILEVASAQGNVGLSTGITHPDLPWPGKLILMFCMWMGRLEIIPVLILISSPFGPRRRRTG